MFLECHGVEDSGGRRDDGKPRCVGGQDVQWRVSDDDRPDSLLQRQALRGGGDEFHTGGVHVTVEPGIEVDVIGEVRGGHFQPSPLGGVAGENRL